MRNGSSGEGHDLLPTAKMLEDRPELLLEILEARKSGLSFNSIETKFSLRAANGMTAWRACKRAAALEPTYRQRLDSELHTLLLGAFPKTPEGDLPFVVSYLREWSLKTKENIFDELASQPPPSPPNQPHFNAQMDRLIEVFGFEYRWAAEGAKWRYGLNTDQWDRLCGKDKLSIAKADEHGTLVELEHRCEIGLLLVKDYMYRAVKKLGIAEKEDDQSKLYDEWRKIEPLLNFWRAGREKMIWLPVVYIVNKTATQRQQLSKLKNLFRDQPQCLV